MDTISLRKKSTQTRAFDAKIVIFFVSFMLGALLLFALKAASSAVIMSIDSLKPAVLFIICALLLLVEISAVLSPVPALITCIFASAQGFLMCAISYLSCGLELISPEFLKLSSALLVCILFSFFLSCRVLSLSGKVRTALHGSKNLRSSINTVYIYVFCASMIITVVAFFF